ncbi:hypothetical protein H0H92_005933, partial [Tricholoma furcatifolium]
ANSNNTSPTRESAGPAIDPRPDEGRRGTEGGTQINTHPPKKNCRGALKIASLNMKRGGSTATTGKWSDLNHMLRNDKIDVLILQETHLTDARRDDLNHIYRKRMHILSTINKEQPNAMGVAIILNKETTKWSEAETVTIWPGQALLVTFPWGNENTFSCLAVYALNAPYHNTIFWNDIRTSWDLLRLEKPICMVGDFNVVEDTIDRLPSHHDANTQTEALDRLKTRLGVADGWRRKNPQTIDFSFRMEGRNIQSRIGQIYVQEDLLLYSHE